MATAANGNNKYTRCIMETPIRKNAADNKPYIYIKAGRLLNILYTAFSCWLEPVRANGKGAHATRAASAHARLLASWPTDNSLERKTSISHLMSHYPHPQFLYLGEFGWYRTCSAKILPRTIKMLIETIPNQALIINIEGIVRMWGKVTGSYNKIVAHKKT